MDRFCFSTVARIIKCGLQPPNENIAVCRMMLGWITSRPSVKNRMGDSIDIDDKLVGRLFNNQSNVPKAIEEEVSNEKILPAALNNAKGIIENLNFNTKDDMYERLIKLIDDDTSISKQKKKIFHTQFSNEDKTEFIAHVILYALSVPNKFSELSSADELTLLTECNGCCPVCGVQLSQCSEKGLPLIMYECVRIYPSNSEQERKLIGVPKPDNPDSLDNQILLCPKHAKEYEKDLSPETYEAMRSKKDKLIQGKMVRAQIQAIQLEQELNEVITTLGNMDQSNDIVELKYDALHIQAKIPEDFLLREDVERNVLRYFNFITGCFSRLDQKKTGVSEQIAMEIKLSYLKLKDIYSQSEIVELLAESIEEKAAVDGISKVTYRILVHYFIQHCEVFDAFSK